MHRGAGQSMDVSADLTELARTDVCVVSAGVKSILDIGLTLEKAGSIDAFEAKAGAERPWV